MHVMLLHNIFVALVSFDTCLMADQLNFNWHLFYKSEPNCFRVVFMKFD